MKTKQLTTWILLLTLLISLWSCRGMEGKKTDVPAGNGNLEENVGVVTDSEGKSWLTHIYSSRDIEVPVGWELSGSAGIDYRAETDEFRALMLRSEEIEEEDGRIERIFERRIIAWDGQGERKAEYPLRDEEHRWRSFGQACFFGDLLYVLLWEYDGQSFVGIWDIPSGELKAEKPTAEIPNWDPRNSIRELAADGDGNLYISGGKQVTILSAQLAYRNELKVKTVDMERTPDGEMWAICPDMAGYGLFRLDPEKGKEKLTYLDAKASQLAFVPSGSDAGWAALSSTGEGICRFDPAGSDGDRWLSSELMNFANSRITYSFDAEYRLDAEKMAAAADEDRFVFLGSMLGADGAYRMTARLYEKAPDLDLSSIRTLLLAHEKPIPDNILTEISRFNRAHDDIRVTTLDYSSYNNSENPLGGAFRLATDILNGLIRPDIVYGDWTFDPVKTLMNKGATVDLGLYLDADPEVNRETVAGCVLRAFDNGEGGFWGLSPFFRIRGISGLSSVLGRYADGWDLEGFLDFAGKLPAGSLLTSVSSFETRGGVEVDFSAFVREDGCAFDSPVFIRYLGWLKVLPTEVQMKMASPAAGLILPKDLKPYLADGTVVLDRFSASETGQLLSLADPYGGADVSVPGFPTSDGSGNIVEAEDVFVIPSAAPDPNAAWEFLRSLMLASDLADVTLWNPSGMTAYLPALEKEFDDHLLMKKAVMADGMTMEFLPDSGDGYIKDVMKQAFPGIAYEIVPYCSEKDVETAKRLVKTAGRPFREQISVDVQSIVNEEISAFLGGVGTAEDCAKKIQSRASIWLAEHK